MKYPVIKEFKDKYTGEMHNPGGFIVTDEEARAKDLQLRRLIGKGVPEEKKAESPAEPKHVGGGIYELPNGDRIKGRQAALEAMGGD